MVSDPVDGPVAHLGDMRAPQQERGVLHNSKTAARQEPLLQLMFCEDESVPLDVLSMVWFSDMFAEDVMAERMHHIWQPRKSVQELLTFVRHLQVDLECCYGTMIVAMMYMQRLRHKFEAAKVDTRDVSCQQLFMICMMIASKFVSDMPFTNQQWAESSGLSLQHVNHLERSTINALEFALNVQPERFYEFRSFLERMASARTGKMATGGPMACGAEAALAAPAPALHRPSVPVAMHASKAAVSSDAALKAKDAQPGHGGWAEYVAEKIRALNSSTPSIMAPILSADPLASLFGTSQPQRKDTYMHNAKPSLSRMSSVSSTASTASIPSHLMPPLPVTSNVAADPSGALSMGAISYPDTAGSASMYRPPSSTRHYYANDLPAPRGSFAHRPALRPLAPKAFLPHGPPRYIANPFSSIV